MPQAPQIIAALAEILDAYDAVFCDVWGVLHNGIAAFPEAATALCDARAAGRAVVLVTNSPRDAASVAAFLAGIGIGPNAFDAIATSGDVTRELVAAAPPRLFHIGIPAHRVLFTGLDIELVDADRAEAVVVTGLFDDDRESPADYRELLQNFADRNLPLICANPDIVAPRGERIVWCAGALARDYAALGGDVRQAGKPFGPIYDLAVTRAGNLERRRILAIGDGLATDIRGANDYGLDALLILAGIHAENLGTAPSGIAAALRGEKLTARYAMPALR